MTITEREDLAFAYMYAWSAIKHRPVSVKVLPNGWFEKRHQGYSFGEKVRASALLAGLVTLTKQLDAKANKVTA